MKPKTLFILLFFLFNQINAQQWRTLGPVPSAPRYDDVYFIDAMTGWTVNGSGEIFKTSDGGLSWNEIYTSTGFLRSVDFINSEIGFVGSLNGRLLRTENGGETWTNIKDQIPHAIGGVCGLSHVGDNVYGVGIWNYPAYFIKSEDKGITWTYTDMSLLANGLVDCHFLSDQVGFVSGTRNVGVIFKTTDGGATWHEVFTSTYAMEYVWKMFFLTDEIAYASVESSGVGSTRIAKTSDGGETWTEMEVAPENLDIQGIGFINEQKGWVSPRYSELWETTDGGISWATTDYGISNVNRFFRLNEQNLYASGDAIHKYDSVTVSNKHPETTATFDIIDVNPNPFSDNFKISLQLDTKTHVKLDMISIDGSHIVPLMEATLNSGIHEYQFSKEDLSQAKSGANILWLRTNEGFLSKQIMCVK